MEELIVTELEELTDSEIMEIYGEIPDELPITPMEHTEDEVFIYE